MFDLRDALGEPLVWLLEVRVGEDALRFAQAPVEAPTGPQGALEPYLQGLDFSGVVADSVDPFSEAPSAKKVGLTLTLAEGFNIPAMVEAGWDFSAARGRLWLWSPTTGALSLMVNGVVRDVEYALPGDPLTCSLEELEEDDSALFPPANALVSLVTWTTPADAALGELYPWIIGSPGATTSWVAPALLVDTAGDLLLVAGHPVQATSVSVVNDDDGTNAILAVIPTTDGLGRAVSLVDLTASGITIDPKAKYFVRWNAAGAGGGLQKPDGSLLSGAGDVLRWMLGHSRLRIDHGRTAAAVPILNSGFGLDTVIQAAPDARFSPWDWIADHLLPILPVSVRTSSEGFYPVAWRLDATADMAVAHLDAPARATLQTAVSWSRRDDVANELVIHFAQDPREDRLWGRRVLTGDPLRVADDADAALNLSCFVSRTRYRDANGQPETRVKEYTSEVVEKVGTAASVLAWWAQRYALQARLVGYTADLASVGHLEPGDVVTVTHPDLAWALRVFLVEEVARGTGGTLDVALRAVEDPAQVRKGIP